MTPSLLTPVVLVIGASGGLGASSWAAALARRMAMHFGECVLIDGDVRGGGLDMTCGTEHVPGLRWPDLARLRGATSSGRLVAALPHGEVPVLSAGGRGAAVQPSVVLDVLGSLCGEVPVVVDCPWPTEVAEALLAGTGAGAGAGAEVGTGVGAEAVHVVSGLQARQLADTEALVCQLTGSHVGLVTRSSAGLGPEFDEVLEHLGAPHLAHVRDDARVRRDGERGEWPGLRGPLRDAADRVVLDLLDRMGSGAGAGAGASLRSGSGAA